MNVFKSLYVYVSILLILKTEFGFSKSVWRSKCPRLQIPNAQVRLKKQGRFAKINCRKRFVMIGGDRRLSCIWNHWNGRIPFCIRNGCKEIALVNGDVMEVYDGALLHFNCKPGYVLEGSPSLFCDGSIWNATSPNCQIPPPKDDHTSCTFEFDTDEMCGWHQDHLDNGNWVRTSGALSLPGQLSINADNTLKTKEGHYIHADLQAGSTKFVARIFSPILEVPSLTPSCIIFYYLILGSSSGVLNVYLKPEDVLFELIPPVTSHTASDVHSWKIQVLLILPPIEDFFQVVFEVVSDDPLGRRSNFAIDDFELASGEKCIELNPLFNHKQTTEQEDETTYVSSTFPAAFSTKEYEESIFTVSDDPQITDNPALTKITHTLPIRTTKSSEFTNSNADQYTTEQVMLQGTDDIDSTNLPYWETTDTTGYQDENNKFTALTPNRSTISKITYLNLTTRFIRFPLSPALPATTEPPTLRWKTLTPYIPSTNKSDSSKSETSAKTLLSTLVNVRTFSNEPTTTTTPSFQRSTKIIRPISKNNEDSNSFGSDYYTDGTTRNKADSEPLPLNETAPGPKRIMIPITGVIAGIFLLIGGVVAIIWTKRKRRQQTAEDANFQRFENEIKTEDQIQEGEANSRKCFSTSYRILENNSYPLDFEGSVP